jgi:RNA polymerase sigma-70 factor (ECF subfamily)
MAPSDKTTKISDTSAQQISLVEQAIDGKRSAFAQLADQFHEDIFRTVFYRVRSRADAEDITQDVFLKAFQKISSIKDASKFRGWLFSIALNRIKDLYRKRRFRSLFKTEDENLEYRASVESESDQPEALDQVLREDFWRQVKQVLDKLSKMEREVFMLRFFDQLSLREIADVLKKNESTVKTHLYRALAKFRKEPAMRQLLKEASQ